MCESGKKKQFACTDPEQVGVGIFYAKGYCTPAKKGGESLYTLGMSPQDSLMWV